MASFVFVDSRVQAIDRLLADLDADTRVVILDASRDGITPSSRRGQVLQSHILAGPQQKMFECRT